MKPRQIVSILFGSSLLLFAGCVDESVDGERHVFFIQRWIVFAIFGVGLIAPIVGWFLREKKPWIGWALLIVGPIGALFLGPTLYMNKAVVSQTGFSLHIGHWISPDVHDLNFDEIKVIRITKEEKREGKRGRTTVSYQMVCQLKSGESHTLPLGEVLEKALPLILDIAKKKGILIRNLT